MVRYSGLAFVTSMIVFGAAAVAACAEGEASTTNEDAAIDASSPATADAGASARDDASPPVTSVGCPHAEEPEPREFTKIYDPSVGEKQPFYINDHTFVRDEKGTWHLFGTTHAEPLYRSDEKTVAHATAPSLQGPWTKQASALVADNGLGETLIWGPSVVRDGDKYFMFYASGGSDRAQFQISLATSTDLATWTREPAPLFKDGYDARDPFVLRVGNEWVLYYTATSELGGGNHVVAYRTSTDLRSWSAKKVAFTDPTIGTNGGPTESPFVVARGADFYLFIGPRDGFGTTAVFHSKDPFSFDPHSVVARFESHATEIVQDADGKTYASRAGAGEGGVHLSPLEWLPVKCEVLEGSTYRAIVETSPRAGLIELSFGGENLLSSGFRVTGPYLGVARFADRPAAAAGSVTVSDDHKRVTLKGITFPGESVTADWALCAGDIALDLGIAWHVPTQIASVHEVALGLSSRLVKARDASSPPAAEDDFSGFGSWSLLTNSATSILAAYLAGSAWQEDNRWLSSKNGSISYQPVWSLGGKPLPAGDFAGGQYRLVANGKPDDGDSAAAIAKLLNSTPSTCVP